MELSKRFPLPVFISLWSLSLTHSLSLSSCLPPQIVHRSTTTLWYANQSTNQYFRPTGLWAFLLRFSLNAISQRTGPTWTSKIKKQRMSHTGINNLFVWTRFVPFQVSNRSRNKSCWLNLLDSQDSIPFRATPWKHNNRIIKPFWVQASTSPGFSLCFPIYTPVPLNARFWLVARGSQEVTVFRAVSFTLMHSLRCKDLLQVVKC